MDSFAAKEVVVICPDDMHMVEEVDSSDWMKILSDRGRHNNDHRPTDSSGR